MTQCIGWVGPSAEVCDGIDNNCDGTVDNGVPASATPAASINLRARPAPPRASNGTLVYQGGVQAAARDLRRHRQPTANGAIDEQPLADGPAPAMKRLLEPPRQLLRLQEPSTGVLRRVATANERRLAHRAVPRPDIALSARRGRLDVLELGDAFARGLRRQDNNCNGIVDDGVQNVGSVCGAGCVNNVPCPCIDRGAAVQRRCAQLLRRGRAEHGDVATTSTTTATALSTTTSSTAAPCTPV